MNKIIVFGDSHSRYFERNLALNTSAPWVRKLDLEVHKIPASTIIGLGKKRSTLNLREKVNSVILENPDATYVFGFGQVDLELGYYYKKLIKGEIISLNEYVNYLVDEYKNFLTQLPVKRIIIKGLNLTVLKNDQFATKYITRIITENIEDKQEIRRLSSTLSKEIDSFRDRNSATIRFNNNLNRVCNKKKWGYFDINDMISGFNINKGVIDDFIPGNFDHHIVDSLQIRKIHFSQLRNSINSLGF